MHDQAIECYKEAIKLDNNNIIYRSNLSQCYLNLHE